jgi:hypothetical protein
LRFSIFIVLSLALSSCFHGNRLDEVNYTRLFHGGHSRLWVINTSQIGLVDEQKTDRFKNEVLVFYDDGTVVLSDLAKLYQGQGKEGTYSVYSSNKEIDIRFGNERWFYTFEIKDEHYLVLSPNEGSSTSFMIYLSTIPEL